MTTDVVAAVDVGGTRIKAALVERDGTELVSLTEPTPPGLDAPGALVTAVTASVAALRGRAAEQGYAVHVAAGGVVVPGIVDDLAGVARWSANLGWRDVPVVEPLVSRLGVPVALGHDVRAGLVAEARFGAAQGFSNVLFMPIGTGIAGALMLDGHVVVADGWSGELGHVIVESDGPQCGCGARGCLEALASASSIEAAYGAASGARLGGDAIAALVAEEDPRALEVWARAVRALARAVVLTTTLTGVNRVLVGGGLARSGGAPARPAAGGGAGVVDLPAEADHRRSGARRPGRLSRLGLPRLGSRLTPRRPPQATAAPGGWVRGTPPATRHTLGA